MQAILQHLIQRGIDGSVAVKPGFAGEFGGNDTDAEMGFAAAIERAAVAMMVAGMQMALVDDLQAVGREGLPQLLFGNKSSVH